MKSRIVIQIENGEKFKKLEGKQEKEPNGGEDIDIFLYFFCNKNIYTLF